MAAEAFAKLYFMGRVDVDVNVLARMLYLLFTPDTQLDAPLRQVNLLECVVVLGNVGVIFSIVLVKKTVFGCVCTGVCTTIIITSSISVRGCLHCFGITPIFILNRSFIINFNYQ